VSIVRGRSLKSRLTRTLIGLGLISVVLLATVNFFVVRQLLDRGSSDQLRTVRTLQTEAVDLVLQRALNRVAVLGQDPGVAAALVDLQAAYGRTDQELDAAQLDQLRAAYAPVVGAYDAAGVEHPPVDELLPSSTAGRYVQYEYIATNGDEPRADLRDAGDGSEYSSAHAEHHDFLRSLASSFGAADLLLVGLDTGDVVYSTDKYVDLGTNVNDGPYAATGLGTSFAKLAATATDHAAISDMAFYLPNSSAPVVHIAAAVRSDVEVVGAIVLTLRADGLTDLVTAGRDWDLLGLGDTGESYIVGTDRRLRTIPRAWFEDPAAYRRRFLSNGGSERDADLMDLTGSPVLLQTVDNTAVQTALEGDLFTGRVDDYLDRSVVAASGPLTGTDLGWVLVTQQQTRESRHELVQFVISILIVLAVLLVVLAVVGAVLARMLARPVQPLVAAAARIADGDYLTPTPDLGRNELGDVSRQLGTVASRLREQDESIAQEEARITTMLASVLPPALVDPVRQGRRELAEVVDTATVVSVTVRGIPAPSGADQDAIVELTTRLSDATTGLAAEFGLERGQVALEHQLFVAGRGHPDIAAEAAAAFATAVVAAIPAIGDEFGAGLTARAGLAAGAVATGVLGSRQVSFGVWGPPVNAAVRLSARAAAGQVVAEDAVVVELGDDWSIAAVDGSDAAVITPVAEVTPGG